MSDLNIKPILEWFQQAKPNPTAKDICVQIGCHYEEFAEMMLSTNDKTCYEASSFLSLLYKNIHDIDSKYLVDSLSDSKLDMLDALCDQIVTAIGVAYMMGFDIEKALSEVNRSNWSKFVDGKPQFNEQGKIAKPESYSPPELTNFIVKK